MLHGGSLRKTQTASQEVKSEEQVGLQRLAGSLDAACML